MLFGHPDFVKGERRLKIYAQVQLFRLYKFLFHNKVNKVTDCNATGKKQNKIGLDSLFSAAAPPRAEMQTFAASEAGLEIGFSTLSMKSHFV